MSVSCLLPQCSDTALVFRKNLNDCYTELIQICRFLAMQIALETANQIEQTLEIHYSEGCHFSG